MSTVASGETIAFLLQLYMVIFVII